MAWNYEDGAKQVMVSVPDGFDEETLEPGVYDTGKRRRGNFFSTRYYRGYEDVELRSGLTIGPPEKNYLPEPTQYHHENLPEARRRADGCPVIHFWDLTAEEQERLEPQYAATQG